jgi:hypothetical protein
MQHPDDLDPQMLDSFREFFQLLSNMMAHSCRLRKPISIFMLRTDFTKEHVQMDTQQKLTFIYF